MSIDDETKTLRDLHRELGEVIEKRDAAGEVADWNEWRRLDIEADALRDAIRKHP